jgi:hypothetical protein
MGSMNDSFQFSENYSLLCVLATSIRRLLTHTITDLYNIIEYYMMTLKKSMFYAEDNVLLIRRFATYRKQTCLS